MKKLLFSGIFVIVFGALAAQNYNTGVGVRLGSSSGLTVKQFIKPNAAIEGILGNRWGGWNTTVLYEFHNRVFKTRKGGTGGLDSQRFHWLLGVGGHVGFWKNNGTNPWYAGNTGQKHTVFGVDGIIGLEYAFMKTPVSLTLDYKPAFNLVGLDTNNGLFWGDEAALSIRYIF